MIQAFGSARNDIMPCFFALLGVFLLYEGRLRRKGRRVLHLLAGVAVAIAVGSKLSYVFVPVVVFTYTLVHRPRRTDWLAHFRISILPLGLGMLIGASAIIYYALFVWDAFVYDVLTYQLTSATDWHTRNGNANQLTLGSRLGALRDYLLRGTTLISIVFFVFVLFAAWSTGSTRATLRCLIRQNSLMFVLLLLAAVPFTLVQKTAYNQYFQPLVPFLVLTVAALYVSAGRFMRTVRLALLVAMALVASIPGLFQPADSVDDRSVVGDVHAVAKKVRSVLSEAGLDGKVATLAPVRVIDAGTPVYREFAAGPFFYRSAGNLLSPQRVRELNGVSPDTLEEFLDGEPPAAIFTGFERGWSVDLDAAFEAYAKQRGYVQVKGDFGRGKLFLRRDQR
jgi:hypothetical protein